MNAIELKGIKRIYDGQTVLDIESFEVKEGERIALVGPNGSGKSTFLMIASLLARPDEGSISVYGEQVNWGYPEKQRNHMTLVAQEPYFFTGSLFRNLVFALQGEKLTRDEIHERIDGNLKMLELDKMQKRTLKTFSTGERKRAAIARALCKNTPILLLDEPFAHVDSQSAMVVEEVMRNMDRARTLIFATHEITRAYGLADRIITLHYGRISPWTPENIYRMKARIVADGSELFTESGIALYYPRKLNDGSEYKLTVNSKDVIVSKGDFESSAQNQIRGRIVRIESAGDNLIEFTVNCTSDFSIKATITSRALKSLDVTVGDEVCVSFKSSAIHVFV